MTTDVIAVIAIVVFVVAMAVVACIGGGNLRRRAGGWPAPGDGQPPVPGDVSPGEAAHPPSRPSPAPGLTYEDVLHLVLWSDELRDRL